MVSTPNYGSHTSHGIELIAHLARAPPNLPLNIKGETLVELYDDAYYFWHPGTETFLAHSPDPEYHIIGTPTAAQAWDMRQSLTETSPKNVYYTFWGRELDGKRRRVLDDAKVRVMTWHKHDGENQKWVLKSDGDEDG